MISTGDILEASAVGWLSVVNELIDIYISVKASFESCIDLGVER